MRLSGVAVTMAVVLLVVGCSASPTPTATAEPSTFLDDMRATKGFFGADDKQLRDVGESVCAALRNGSSFEDVGHYLTVGGLTKTQATDVIFASAKEYCPEVER